MVTNQQLERVLIIDDEYSMRVVLEAELAVTKPRR
jgi:hypothetical protein